MNQTDIPCTQYPDNPFNYFNHQEVTKQMKFVDFQNREVCYYGLYPYSYGTTTHPVCPMPSNCYLQNLLNYLKVVIPDVK